MPRPRRSRRPPKHRARRARMRRGGPRRRPHEVSFKVPERPMAYKDIVFIIRRGRLKVGEMRISQGGIDWRPRKGKVIRKRTWEQIQRLLSRR